MTTFASSPSPVRESFFSKKVEAILDKCDRDPALAKVIVHALRRRLPCLISTGLVSGVAPPTTMLDWLQPLPAATTTASTKDDEAQNHQKPIIPLQLVIPDRTAAPLAQLVAAEQEENCEEGKEMISILLRGLPIQWEAKEVIDFLGQEGVEEIAGVQVKPGYASVQLKSKQRAVRCLSLHGTLLPHLFGSWPVAVEFLPDPSLTGLSAWTEPQTWTQPQVPTLATQPQVPVSFTPPSFDSALCDATESRVRVTGSHRKAARSKSTGPVEDVAMADNDDVNTVSAAENLLNMMLQRDKLPEKVTDEVAVTDELAQNLLKKHLSVSCGDAP